MKCENKPCGAYKGGVCKLNPMTCYAYMPPEGTSQKTIDKWRKKMGIDEMESCWVNDNEKDAKNSTKEN